MAVLELTEESRAMRNAAKGWAAGKIALEDYRMIRRATLAAMLGIDPDEEETVAGSLADEPSDDTETIEHVPQAAPAKGSNTTMLMIAGGVVVVAGLLALLLVGS